MAAAREHVKCCMVDFLASDAHNASKYCLYTDVVYKVIKRFLGDDAACEVMYYNPRQLLGDGEITLGRLRYFHKRSFVFLRIWRFFKD